MRKGNLLVLLVAIVMGGFAAYLARNWIQAQGNVAAAAPTGTIVVAGAPLGFGIAVSRENVAEIPWAASRLPREPSQPGTSCCAKAVASYSRQSSAASRSSRRG